MTEHRWTSLFWTALALALFVALPAAAAPAPTTPAAPDLAASYAAIFASAPATETGFTIIYCCSATYCCEAMMSSECDGTRFGSIFSCAMHCSFC
jgi:hypothetical protein